MAHSIVERHNATPYGFYFTTRGRGPEDLDSKQITRSGIYYLGGKVMTLAEVKARHDPGDRILIENMECNHFARVIENANSWRTTMPLYEGDVVLDWKPRK